MARDKARSIELYCKKELKNLEKKHQWPDITKPRPKMESWEEWNNGEERGRINVLRDIIWKFFTSKEVQDAEVERILEMCDLMYGHHD